MTERSPLRPTDNRDNCQPVLWATLLRLGVAGLLFGLISTAVFSGEEPSKSSADVDPLSPIEQEDVSDPVRGTSSPPFAEASEAEILFSLKVQPLFRKKCLSCHGDDVEALEGNFDLRSRASVLDGGNSFGDEVLVPGDADASRLYAMVCRSMEDFEMPPKEAERLTDEETSAVRDWINGGAPWPDSYRVAEIYRKHADGIPWPTRGGLSDDWTYRKYNQSDLWAYQPLQRPNVPGGVVPVDYFIDRKLKALALAPAAPADRRTLIRRASFDLLGLPPTPSEVEQFVADSRSDEAAFAALVDRLLASPHYGEQWGRHWLDVVRYADSSGFANDWERPNAWRYRDYVIRAFNNDMPYDRFVREQIAGDELFNELEAAGEPADGSLRIAAGFLRMGPWEHTGMSVAKVTRQLFLDDVTDSVGQVFLAHALQCARCHDHKFDPVPTRDYYAMQAIFATTQFAEIDTDWLPSENRNGMDEDQQYHEIRDTESKALLADVARRKNDADRKWLQERGLPYKSAFDARKANAPPEHVPPTAALVEPEVFGLERIGRKWQQRFPWESDRYRPIAFTVYNGKTHFGKHSVRLIKPKNPMGKGVLEQTAILTGGDPFAPSEEVAPAVLSAVPTDGDAAVPNTPDGRRRALAEWIVDPTNPLSARVMANRVWQYHFGRGVAENANNFGSTGRKPTHPLLLDWLATELIRNGWSLKGLHRTIMNSAAYRRSSQPADPVALAEVDPNQTSYALFRARRLTAEELRDAMLFVSGELNPALGGIPSRPNMNLEAALQPRMIMGTFAPSYLPNTKPSQRNRRTVYAVKLRGQRDPFLETFNQPGTDKSCERRDSSTVTPQALTLFNSIEVANRALAFAHRVLTQTSSDDGAIDAVYRHAYGREPTELERLAAISHWNAMTKIQSELVPQPKVFPTSVVRQAVDENTGEPFEFTERLSSYEDYQPDLQPHQVDARTRGLADVCLAILNSNEFVYLF